MANRIVHFEIEADDGGRAKKFYEEAFGWELKQMGDEFGGYITVKTGEDGENGINGGIFVSSKEEHERLNAYSCVVSVDDIDKAIEDVKKAGGEIIGEKLDIPMIGTYMKCKDTEGNNFSLLQPAPNMPKP